MCFSAEASFTSSAVLALIGYASIKAAPSKSKLFLAAIPCFFALQQFSEGIIWLNLRGDIAPSFLTLAAQILFLFFAYALWPIWIAFSTAVNEKVPARKGAIWLIMVLGLVAAYMNLQHMPPLEIVPQIVGHSIQYDVAAPLYKKIIYILIVLSPCFISSLRYMWLFGVLGAISSFIAQYLYDYAFTSVWCFSAAIMSFSLYLVLKANSEVETPSHSPLK